MSRAQSRGRAPMFIFYGSDHSDPVIPQQRRSSYTDYGIPGNGLRVSGRQLAFLSDPTRSLMRPDNFGQAINPNLTREVPHDLRPLDDPMQNVTSPRRPNQQPTNQFNTATGLGHPQAPHGGSPTAGFSPQRVAENLVEYTSRDGQTYTFQYRVGAPDSIVRLLVHAFAEASKGGNPDTVFASVGFRLRDAHDVVVRDWSVPVEDPHMSDMG